VEVLIVDINLVWNGALSLFVGLFAYVAHEKFSELARITILLNKTREEIARDNVTKAEVDRITDHIDQRFNRLENKIDQLIESQRKII
jgi:hypothetical protein